MLVLEEVQPIEIVSKVGIDWINISVTFISVLIAAILAHVSGMWINNKIYKGQETNEFYSSLKKDIDDIYMIINTRFSEVLYCIATFEDNIDSTINAIKIFDNKDSDLLYLLQNILIKIHRLKDTELQIKISELVSTTVKLNTKLMDIINLVQLDNFTSEQKIDMINNLKKIDRNDLFDKCEECSILIIDKLDKIS